MLQPPILPVARDAPLLCIIARTEDPKLWPLANAFSGGIEQVLPRHVPIRIHAHTLNQAGVKNPTPDSDMPCAGERKSYWLRIYVSKVVWRRSYQVDAHLSGPGLDSRKTFIQSNYPRVSNNAGVDTGPYGVVSIRPYGNLHAELSASMGIAGAFSVRWLSGELRKINGDTRHSR